MADINLGVGGANSATGGYEIDNSCKFEADNAEKMTHTYDSAPTSQKKGTISLWFKRTEIGSNIGVFQFGDDSSGDYLAVRWGRDIYGSGETYRIRIGGSTNITLDGDGAIRDTSAWYHMVIAIDTTQATASNRFRVYRNGAEVSMSTDNRSSLTQNTDMAIGENGKDIMIGEGVYKYNGYIAEVNYVDGQQLTPSDFGEYDSDSGIWIPKKYTGTYGNNGFYLDFKNASNLGEDQSGNNHDFTLSNITSADQATDTPTNNFATGNPILYFSTATTVSEGSTKIAKGANGWEMLASTMAVTKGKWYVEVRNETIPESAMASIMPDDIELIFRGGQTLNYPGKVVGDNGQSYYSYNGNYYRNGGNESYGASWTGSTNTIGIALDMDNGKLYFAKDNTWQNSGDPTSGSTGTGAIDVLAPTKPHLIGYTPYAANTDGFINFGGYTGAAISSGESDANGYGTFEYAPPSGYYALCTKNLAEYG